MAEVKRHEVSADEDGMRLDRWFKIHFPQVTFAYLNKLTRTGQVRVGAGRCKTNSRLKAGDDIDIQVAGRNSFAITKKPGARALLAQLRKFRGRLPADFRFDRLEANQRG